MSSIFARTERRNISLPVWWISCVDSTCDLGQRKREFEPRPAVLCASWTFSTASIATNINHLTAHIRHHKTHSRAMFQNNSKELKGNKILRYSSRRICTGCGYVCFTVPSAACLNLNARRRLHSSSTPALSVCAIPLVTVSSRQLPYPHP